MDKSLARGHVKMFLAKMPTGDDIGRRIQGKRLSKVMDLVNEARSRKRHDRILKQMKRVLGDKFCNTEILCGRGRDTVGMSVAISVSQDVGMLMDAEDDAPLFRECTLDLDRLMISANESGVKAWMTPYASVSMHAMARLVQRDAIASDNLAADMRKALFLTEHVSHRYFAAGMEDELINMSVLIPFRGGALVAAFVPMQMQGTEYLEEGTGHRICVRTFLSDRMLSDWQRERMEMIEPELAGLKISQMRGPLYFREDEDEEERKISCKRWRLIFEQNARPWRPSCQIRA